MKTLIAGALLALAATGSLAQDKLRIAGNFATEHSSSVSMEQVFKTELARLTNNQLGVDVFPAMQLGGAKENVDAVRSGTLFMTWVGAAFLSRIVPELEAVSLPFQFDSREQAFRVVDGEVGRLIDVRLGDKGFISMGWMELGTRHITNSQRPIKAVADLKGLKIRLQPNETHLATFRALGANAVAMDPKELYSALEQKVIDGQENPYQIIFANRYGEVQKFLSDSAHFFDFISVVANRRQFEALKPEYQAAVRQAMTVAVAHQRKLAIELDARAFEALKSRMQFDPLPAAARDEMRRTTAGIVDTVKKRVAPELVDRVVAETAKAR
ncbi:MAG: TRAP transporter substrate-binding protein [Burkholderiales bacterium]|nr:TRAP transporter substrate-binding protein [Burkholderiales bacterium]